MSKIISWRFEEVEKALDLSKTPQMLSNEIHRTPVAIEFLRNNARAFERGRRNYITKNLQSHFNRFYKNKGDMQLKAMQTEAQTESIPVEPTELISVTEPTAEKGDHCEEAIAVKAEAVEKQFQTLQAMLMDIASIQHTHENHVLLEELQDSRSKIRILTDEKDEALQQNAELSERWEGQQTELRELRALKEAALTAQAEQEKHRFAANIVRRFAPKKTQVGA